LSGTGLGIQARKEGARPRSDQLPQRINFHTELFFDPAHPGHTVLALLFNQALYEPRLRRSGGDNAEQGHPHTDSPFKGRVMNIPKQMEALFLLALGLVGTAYSVSQVAHASAGSHAAAPTALRSDAPAQAVPRLSAPMQVVIITGKRMTAREKAAYDAQHDLTIMQASN
jgi:hypothetical protein